VADRPSGRDPLRVLAAQAREYGSVTFRVDGQLFVCLPASAFTALATTTFSPNLEELEAAALEPAPTTLTERQREVLRLLAAGVTTVEAAERLGVSINTVAAHLVAIRRKYGVSRTAHAIARAQEEGQL